MQVGWAGFGETRGPMAHAFPAINAAPAAACELLAIYLFNDAQALTLQVWTWL